ncbi:MAG TPA: hypothetical protein VF017_00835 [Thermoanaerobaculia bacterium]|nr:hypothetical protein [Thermoanaerobaculia bacterium]
MRNRCHRLLAAGLVLGLLAPVAMASPSGGLSWWEEVWQLLVDLRPAAWWSLDADEATGRRTLPEAPVSAPASSYEKEGAGYDPSGKPIPPPPDPGSP